MKKKVLVIVNISKDESLSLAEKIDRFLKNQGIETVLYDFDGFVDEASFLGYELVITLGGDGTVLFGFDGCLLQATVLPLYVYLIAATGAQALYLTVGPL